MKRIDQSQYIGILLTSWVWWSMPVISALGRQRQEDCKFPVWVMQDPVSKKKVTFSFVISSFSLNHFLIIIIHDREYLEMFKIFSN
jgi:hypothetical protein